jgi:hypothetical protein
MIEVKPRLWECLNQRSCQRAIAQKTYFVGDHWPPERRAYTTTTHYETVAPKPLMIESEHT